MSWPQSCALSSSVVQVYKMRDWARFLHTFFLCSLLSSLVADNSCCFFPSASGPCFTSQQLFSNCVYKSHRYTGEIHCFSLVKVEVLEFCFFSYKIQMLVGIFFPFDR